ncbi:hypothetical protein EGR_10381 [Echinococcus granulosus]|uniref:Expressed conserved protein n=1 Tax=Echinococcus granulosus TaxID=6210 RepID=U6J526_ECHGR|nr:hypothetical protein EGR_10381 [Echinococcus granulosus]EUB54762.1 hypothetical protein EGR_10381 [Echinococcus granulosus]CDS18401.1 expressed conserved protein [Echinococcus granulosus]
MDNESFWGWLNCTKRSTGCNCEFYAEKIGKFCTYNVCNYIFSFCNKLKTPDSVPFIAFVLYDRFLCFELQSIFRSCHNIDTAQVKRVLLRKKKDIILHLYSVIQLTTKSVDRRKVLKASALQKIFKKSSMEVDIEHIINSEAYVLGSLQDGLHCFDLLTSVEFFTCLNDRFATKVNLENVVDVLYVISANLSKLRSEIHLVFRKNIQPHICLRILTASAIVCAALKSSQLALAYSRTCSSLLTCSVDELLAVVHCILCLF